MRAPAWLRFAAAGTVLLAPPAGATETPGPATAGEAQVLDVALSPEGLLVGQLVSPEGRPLAGRKVRVQTPQGRSAVTQTGAGGEFAFRGVSGPAQVVVDDAHADLRVWPAASAPPAATPALLLVREEGGLVRGQHPAGPITRHGASRAKRLLANPWVMAGVVATAVAVPVAIHNADDDDASTP